MNIPKDLELIAKGGSECRDYKELVKSIGEGVDPKTLNVNHPANEYEAILNELNVVERTWAHLYTSRRS